MTWSYRPALDGARTLAVYLVVLFHAGVSWMDGGFLGVDLFFVLSGFLVSTILYGELEDRGRLDLVRFYDRRVRRLLPAAVLLIIVVSAASVLVLSQVERASITGDARAALLYYANWRFLLQSNDYFGATVVDSSPFLHFWSLSIEEQFYFVFPVLLLLLVRLNRVWKHAAPTVLALLLVASLGAQLWWAGVDENHAYYGTETRFYQLLAGVLLALVLHRWRLSAKPSPVPAWVTPLVTVVSLVGLVVTATSWVSLSPSWRGIVGCVFACGLVGSLSGATPHVAARPFVLPPVVYLGKISYGTYLWHWPVVVLAEQVIDPPRWQFVVLVAVLSTALAAASYHMLETPIRQRRITAPWRLPVVATGLAASVVTAFLVVPPTLASAQPVAIKGGQLLDDPPEEASGAPPKLDYEQFSQYREAPARSCTPADLSECEIVSGQDGPTVWLFGDSQSREMEPTMRMLAEEHGFNLYVASQNGCPWPLGMHSLVSPPDRRESCAQLKEDFFGPMLRETEPDLVLLVQQDRSGPLFTDTTSDSLDGGPVDDVDRLYAESVDRTLQRISDAGARTLLLESLWLPPEDADPLSCLAGATSVADCVVPVPRTVSPVDATYVSEAVRRDDVWAVDLNPVFCPEAPLCSPVLDGTPVWRDSRHVSAKVQEQEREKIWQRMVDTGAFSGLSPAPR